MCRSLRMSRPSKNDAQENGKVLVEDLLMKSVHRSRGSAAKWTFGGCRVFAYFHMPLGGTTERPHSPRKSLPPPKILGYRLNRQREPWLTSPQHPRLCPLYLANSRRTGLRRLLTL